MPAEHTERGRVTWIDTDASGRIHYSAVFRWAEKAEIELHRTLGLIDSGWRETPRKRVEATYEKPLRFDDEIETTLRVVRVGRTSIEFAWEVRHEGEVAVAGAHVTVHVGADGRPEPLPDDYRARLEA